MRPLVAIGERLKDGATRRVRLLAEPWDDGELPLPPYLRQGIADPERYQTVYAARPGSVAAPTAAAAVRGNAPLAVAGAPQ